MDRQDIEDILTSSKEENKKYLNRVLKIKNVSPFDAAYIMATLTLNDKKIRLIEYSISKYSELGELNSSESINEYVFQIIQNIEMLEKSNDEILDELDECENEVKSFKHALDYIIGRNLNFLKLKNGCYEENIKFSTIL